MDERTYDEKELDEVFQKGIAWIEGVWLGENESVDAISKDLYFPDSVEELGLRVRWETSNYRCVQFDGKITEEAFSNAPQTVEIYLYLSYGEFERKYTYQVVILSPENEVDDEFHVLLNKTIEALEEENLTNEEIVLPTEIQGKKVVWYKQKDVVWPKIFLFGNIILILLYFEKEEKKIQKQKDRNMMLNQDYPDIVYRLIILIGAGMTVKNAWEKVIEEYEREKEYTDNIRCGYEEMAMTLREMNYGISEIKAYENFGKRCGSQNYMRLAELLIQQVKRGARGMNQLLMQEVTESEIIWRENSRKKSEEAGTKLLLPMVLLMTVVFAVLMIPAFLSISV